ncbi:MAG: ATP-binding protein [Candidatus Omnitrophota bacterium]
MSGKNKKSGAFMDDINFELSLFKESYNRSSLSLEERKVAGFIFDLLKKNIDIDILAFLSYAGERGILILFSDKTVSPKLKKEIVSDMAEKYAGYAKQNIDIGKISVAIALAEQKKRKKGELTAPLKTSYVEPFLMADRISGLMGMMFCSEHIFSSDEKRYFKNVTAQLELFMENDRIKQTVTNERNRLESILRGMTSAVIVIDESEKILLANSVTEMFLGVKSDKIVGKFIDEVISEGDLKEFLSAFISQHSEYMFKEMTINNPAENISRIVKTNLSKVRDYLGNITGNVIILEDITKEKEIDKMKTEFISLTSHELRTPLASIKEAVSLMLDGITGPVNEKQHKFLDIVKRNIDRLAVLINNFLDLSKLESGSMELRKSRVKAKDIIDESMAAFKPLAGDKKIELKINVSEKLPYVRVDVTRIRQVVDNLISNALKFSDSGGKVTINAKIHSLDKNFIEIKIKDTGIGIAQKDFDKLFQKFQQVDSSTTRKAGGSGLGLVIAKQIIEMHGGKIWVESRYGKGSEFIFILPVINKE